MRTEQEIRARLGVAETALIEVEDAIRREKAKAEQWQEQDYLNYLYRWRTSTLTEIARWRWVLGEEWMA